MTISKKMSTLNSCKEQIAVGLTSAMKRQKVTQSELARRMNTSRAVVYRMLRNDPALTIRTLARALTALGCTVSLKFSETRGA